MAKICECCGKENNSFEGDAFYLTNDKILCYKCAKPIRNDINDLYYTKTEEEYEKLKSNIVAKCNESFDNSITEYVLIVMSKIHEKLPFVKEKRELTKSNSAIDSEMDNSSGLFGNIGGKIKGVAQLITWIGIIISVVLGLVLIYIAEEMLLVGLIVIVIGVIISRFSTLTLYGFGQLVENSDKLVALLKKE